MDTPANFAGVKPSIDRQTLWLHPIPPARVLNLYWNAWPTLDWKHCQGFKWTEWGLSIGLIALALTLPGSSREGGSWRRGMQMGCY